jgi:hypothetical protein
MIQSTWHSDYRSQVLMLNREPFSDNGLKEEADEVLFM